ncbi:MAG: acetyl-CoA carboxylase biotin carboxylase subunit [Dehalococcoidia bacterium]|nr:acetyl-CoA carboxylase biotin carboxylase subunit [Dehalococcoidia bacterium]
MATSHSKGLSKVLIANRGEIAVRVIRACRELGIRTVAVYSDPDRDALHVRMADEAINIGPAIARQSYLNVDKIIAAAKETGADAIHPGYGFLSEKPELPMACEAAGLTFIGPSASAMSAMGEKTAARRRMRAANVPIVPGALEGVNVDEALRIAAEIGFPVIIKAASGGGGRGVRIVHRADDLPAALESATSEASNAFNDPTVYLERYVSPARHIEMQIIADTHGNCVYLGERECSIQRRLQKLVEESPSVVVDDDLRRRMGEAAVAAAKAVGYVNAGTIEFLVDSDGNFYFMEMNTRLQVEHPVTEFITGVDLVRTQLLVAAGEPLPFKQEDIQRRGWSIEARITAEDPFNNFLPSTGVITYVREPSGPGVRVDSSIYPGLEVTVDYDSLLAKLIVWGDDRAQAIERMRRALREYEIVGVRTSIPFHQILLETDDFINGNFDTAYVARAWPAIATTAHDRADDAALLAAAFAATRGQNGRPASESHRPGPAMSNWKLLARRDQLRRGW